MYPRFFFFLSRPILDSHVSALFRAVPLRTYRTYCVPFTLPAPFRRFSHLAKEVGVRAAFGYIVYVRLLAKTFSGTMGHARSSSAEAIQSGKWVTGDAPSFPPSQRRKPSVTVSVAAGSMRI